MNKKLRWKIVLVVAVIALSIFLFYPPKTKIHLGLDLAGGMHLVLQVVTDDAITNNTDLEIVRVREELDKKNITYQSLGKTEGKIDQFEIREFDLEKEGEIRNLLDDYFRDWNHSSRGTSIIVSLKPGVKQYLENSSVDQAKETLSRRVDELGLTEPTIQRQGLTGDRIIVDLPGVEDPEKVIEILKSTAMLEFRLVKGGPAVSEEALLEAHGGEIPKDTEIMKSDPKHMESGYYLVSNVSEIVGNDLRSTRRSSDQWQQPAVSFSLKPDAAKRFAKMTGDNIDKPLGIALDKKLIEVANIGERIPPPGDTIIHGRFTMESAEELALMLRAGALPAGIRTMENRTIGPSLGADSVRRGFTSIIVALILILVFMGVYYRMAGINAIIALILNIMILMAALAYFKASLTVPGMAGIILTVGMAVDANVLVFERIREELAQGKTVLSSIASGFSRAFRTILDANVTTIITAIFLFQFGTGPLRGFAVTLIIGITASMFTAVFVSRLIFDLTISKKKKKQRLSI